MRDVLIFCLLLAGCCNGGCGSGKIHPAAQPHVEKLRKHFRGENVGEDVSTLISETRAMSEKLKKMGKKEQANKLDSYLDVLTYGNQTIDESLKDVMELARRKEEVHSSPKFGFCSLF
ncbi:MAG: hypothetical protein LBL99_03740 [Holosporaceae bacterium]|jgi:hypothetical protein|nr:hypothetical protein [Holosporaceae bacterium]